MRLISIGASFFANVRHLYQVRRQHRHYRAIARRLSAKNGPLRVVFFVSQPQMWSSDSLYERLRADLRFFPEIIVFPNHEAGTDARASSCESANLFFVEKNFSVRKGYDPDSKRFLSLAEIEPDIVFFDQPHMGLPEEISYGAVSQTALTCYIPYGFEVSRLNEWSFGTDFHNRVWRIFSQTDWQRNQFFRYGAISAANVAVVGYPKFDDYTSPLPADAYRFWKQGRNAKRRVIWAPHWSIGGNNVLNYGTFCEYAETLLLLASRYPQIDWVVKPHQRLYVELCCQNVMTPSEVRSYFERWRLLPNADVYDGGSYIDCFRTSDALITDCGSFLPEYLPTGKPILHLIHPKSKGYNEFGAAVVKTLYSVSLQEDLSLLFFNVIVQGDDPMKKLREQAVHSLGLSLGGAGERIYRCICEATSDTNK
jgi:hypothetical protein